MGVSVYMSKKITGAAAAHNKAAKAFDYMSAMIKAKSKAMATKKGLKALIGVAVLAFLVHLTQATHGLEAVLYIFANNGKLSGRMDGDVKMRNGRSRGFRVPALVRNDFTTGVRAIFGGLSSSFRSLTPSQIASWNDAVGFFYTDRFAQVHTLKGKALFQRLNGNLASAGIAPLTSAPVATGVVPLTPLGLIIAITGSILDLTTTLPSVPLDHTALLFATTSLSNGISRPNQSLFKLYTTLAPADPFPSGTFTEYVTRFGTPVIGATIFVQVKLINNITGEASAISQASAIVGA